MPLMECGEGGYKWGESGKCFTGPGAKEKALAVGKAIKAADKGLLIADSTPFKAELDPTTGFLTAPVKLARTGIQTYFGFELGLQDRPMDKINVFRSSDEVFNPDSIKSYINLIVTDDHPEDLVTTDNVKDLQQGTVSEVKPYDASLLSGVITITDKSLISKVQKGKWEVSVGYTNDLKPEKGEFKGQQYEFIQTNIRANHLAIVDAGRCGPACRLTLDKNQKKEKVMVLTIDGIQYDVEDNQLAQAVKKMQKSHDQEKEAMKKKNEELEKEKDEAVKEKEKAKATADSLEKEKLDDEALNSLIAERAELISQAKTILGDKMPECTDCHVELKSAVVKHVTPDMDLEGKSKDYIDAAFDMAIKKFDKAKKSVESVKKDFTVKDKDGKEITRDGAREKYMKNMGMEV